MILLAGLALAIAFPAEDAVAPSPDVAARAEKLEKFIYEICPNLPLAKGIDYAPYLAPLKFRKFRPGSVERPASSYQLFRSGSGDKALYVGVMTEGHSGYCTVLWGGSTYKAMEREILADANRRGLIIDGPKIYGQPGDGMRIARLSGQNGEKLTLMLTDEGKLPKRPLNLAPLARLFVFSRTKTVSGASN